MHHLPQSFHQSHEVGLFVMSTLQMKTNWYPERLSQRPNSHGWCLDWNPDLPDHRVRPYFLSSPHNRVKAFLMFVGNVLTNESRTSRWKYDSHW